MKKSVIFLTALLLATIAGTYAVYELYVKQRMKELGEHMAQEKVLHARILQLQDTFAKTEPDAILELWRKSTQPWYDAVQGRSQYFTLGDFAKEVEIPEDAIPKIYYRQELPKRIQSLADYAADKQVILSDINCGVPKADYFGAGTNPEPEEIATHLEEYDYCAAMSKLVVDAKPISVNPLRIWPEKEEEAKSGMVVKRTTGISMQISTQALVRFFDKLAQEDRYFRIDEFKISNTNLHQPDPPLTVDMVLTQAYFRPKKSAASAAVVDGGQSAEVNQRLTSLFGGAADAGGSRASRDENDEEAEPTWWQQFRRQWLPF